MDIEELKTMVPMESLLSSLGFEPGRKGRTRCLVHGGDNPTSLSYNSDTWHCFSCGRGGDKIDLVMEALGVDFQGAVRHLAGCAGISTKDVKLKPAGKTTHYSLADLEKDLECIGRKLEDVLLNRLRCLQADLRAGRIALVDYYTRLHIIEQDLADLDEAKTVLASWLTEVRENHSDHWEAVVWQPLKRLCENSGL